MRDRATVELGRCARLASLALPATADVIELCDLGALTELSVAAAEFEFTSVAIRRCDALVDVSFGCQVRCSHRPQTHVAWRL